MDRRVMVVLVGVVLVSAGMVFYAVSPSAGTLVVQVRDAAGTFASLYVGFTQVSVRPEGSAGDWRGVDLARASVDLVALGTAVTTLAQARLPPGTYAAIRIVIAQAIGTLSSGISTTVLVANGELVQAVTFSVRPGAVTTVTLDFDLAASLVPSGSSWVFTPHLGSVTVG